MDQNYESSRIYIDYTPLSSASALLSKIVPVLGKSQPELLNYVLMTVRFCYHILVDFVSCITSIEDIWWELFYVNQVLLL